MSQGLICTLKYTGQSTEDTREEKDNQLFAIAMMKDIRTMAATTARIRIMAMERTRGMGMGITEMGKDMEMAMDMIR